MPYARNADLPDPVKQALPAAAQTIFRKAFNAALKTYNGDESKAAAVAWTAVKNAGYSKPASGKWTLSRTGVDAMPSHEIFLNALTPHQVTCTPTDDGKWLVKGLPLIRTGEWNGNPYTADDLRSVVANFARMRDDDGFTPGLWPQHNYDHDGNIVPQDASNALGFYSNLYLDEDTGVLVGDVEVFDESTAHDMERGKLRYISGEFWRNEDTGLSTTGAAFVPDGAVKGMPWQMVINAADYSDMQPTNKPQTEGGNKPMTILQKIAGLFTKAVEGEDPEVLTQALAELGKEPDAPEDPPEPDPPDDTGPAESTQMEMLQRQSANDRKALKAIEAEVVVLKQENAGIRVVQQHDLADALTNEWRSNGWIPPTSVDFVLPLAQFCLQHDAKVDVLSDEGNVRHERVIDVLAEVLRLSSPIAVTLGASGAVWTGDEDPTAEDEEAQKQLGKKMADSVNQPSTKDD